MGAQQSFCSEPVASLQIPTSVQGGLEQNLKIYRQHSPKNGYARKSSIRPNLSERVQQTIRYLLEAQPLKQEKQQGYQFPCFYIHIKKVYYLGQWSQGLPHGKGKVYFTNGCFFQGWFNKGQAEGEDNIFIYADGSFYRGSFRNSKKNGFGRFFFHNGLQFSGQWKNGKPEGEDCIQKYPDGSIYTGNFINGVKQGKGQYFWADGKKYTGDFKDGYMHGKGILKKGKQSYFEGQFAYNQKQGKGKMKLPYGEYQGPFKNGLMSGQGVFKWNDGRIYRGGFQNGKMHGQGSLTFINGRIIFGQWFNGQNIQIFKVNQL